MVKATSASTENKTDFLSEDALLHRRAIDYYLKASAPDAPIFILNDNLSFEDALAHAAELLHCAVETANASGEAMKAPQRADAFGGDGEGGGGPGAGVRTASIGDA